jgi:hypothetical protein
VNGWHSGGRAEARISLAEGLVWVTVPDAGEVRAYTPKGRLVKSLRGCSDDNPFGVPCGIAVKSDGKALAVSELSGSLALIALPGVSPSGR